MTHRILLADDSVTIRKVVELTFSDEDFEIDSVGDGAQAFEHARAQRPDIIISDVVMPGLNGYELCEQVKSDPNLRSVPFLFLKGTFESFDEERAETCGSDGFIVKPFESQEMIAKVRKLIERTAAAPSAPPVQPQPRVAEREVAAAPAPAAAPMAAAAAEIKFESGLGAPRFPTEPAAARPVPPPPPPPPPAAAPLPAVAPPAVPRPGLAVPRLVTQQPAVAAPPIGQQRPAAAPPPVPPMQTRPTPPAVPAMPAPPQAPRPTRPIDATPSLAPPLPQPPLPIQPSAPPPPPPPPAAPAAAPPAPAIEQAPVEDFGFDFGETEGDRFAPAAPPAHRTAAPALEASAESDEDLWSEVSLRGSSGDLLEDRGPGAAETAPNADIIELGEETAITAPEGLFEDETVFEEVSTARITPLAPLEPEERNIPPAPLVAPAAVEPPPEPAAPVAESARLPEPPISVDQAAIERIVAARVEAALQQMLEPIVRDLSRTVIEAVAWEVIPDLAEAMIRSEIERVRQSTSTG